MTAGYYILVENEEERGRCWEVVVAWLSWLMKSWKRAKLRIQEPDQQDFTGCDQTLPAYFNRKFVESLSMVKCAWFHYTMLLLSVIHIYIHIYMYTYYIFGLIFCPYLPPLN